MSTKPFFKIAYINRSGAIVRPVLSAQTAAGLDRAAFLALYAEMTKVAQRMFSEKEKVDA